MEYIVLSIKGEEEECFRGTLLECIEFINARWQEFFIVDEDDNIVE